jgi:hypothetical protein
MLSLVKSDRKALQSLTAVLRLHGDKSDEELLEDHVIDLKCTGRRAQTDEQAAEPT